MFLQNIIKVDAEKRVQVSETLDIKTFANVLEYKIKSDMYDNVSRSVKEKMRTTLWMMHYNTEKLSMERIANILDEIRSDIRDRDREKEGDDLESNKEKYNRLYKIALPATMAFYIAMSL